MFSDREQKIIKIIGDKDMTFKKISEKLFKDEKVPLDATIKVSNAVNRIIMKCQHHELDWTLAKRRLNTDPYITVSKIKEPVVV